MKIMLSKSMRDTIQKVLQTAKQKTRVLDIYKAAREVQAILPDENVALEDIVAALLWNGEHEFIAVQFDIRGEVLEIVMPGCEDDGEKVAAAA